MTTINFLSTLNPIQAGDLLPIYSSSNGDARKASITSLTNYMNGVLNFPSFTTQRSSPLASADVQITDGSDNIHLILTPAGTLLDLTLSLPSASNAVDKQEILVNCTQDITTLTIDANGTGAVVGAPAALTSNDFFKLKLDKTGDVWYRVG